MIDKEAAARLHACIDELTEIESVHLPAIAAALEVFLAARLAEARRPPATVHPLRTPEGNDDE